jgi:toxin ParE1/3/4
VNNYRITRAGVSNIEGILARTDETFGPEARHRYQRLIVVGIRDVAADPNRRPRHFLIYRLDGDIVVIGRVLHDAMELARHMESRRISR